MSSSPKSTSGPATAASWRLQDAKARFSEVVRRARSDGPQRVTLHGRDAVVVVAAETFDRDRKQWTGQDLVDAMASAPRGLNLDIERPLMDGAIRDIEL